MQEKHKIKTCARCGSSFECKSEEIASCACMQVDVMDSTRHYLKETSYDCLCSNCLIQLNEMVKSAGQRMSPSAGNLEENRHYYKEGPYLVFTELYHYLKGRCCGNGCRHCAYGNSSKK
ncbi:MAG: cysteine-rich CWC family protein [Sediminibacterium sp.]|nr:cysteine-rich CWC family protein [Sediminibacterium sp.]